MASAGSLITAMETAVDSAQSVHISGSMVVKGQTEKVDLSITRSGDVFGSVSAGSASYNLLVTGGHMYVAPNLAYLTQLGVAASECPVLCGKYADVGNSAPTSFTMSALFSAAFKKLDPAAMTVTGKKTVDGQSVWVLTASDGTGYIAVHGKPYLLRSASAGEATDFSQWNAVTIPASPAPSQMVDQSKLPNG